MWCAGVWLEGENNLTRLEMPPRSKQELHAAQRNLALTLATGRGLVDQWVGEMSESRSLDHKPHQHIRTGKMTERRHQRLRERGGCSTDTLSILHRLQKRVRQFLQQMRAEREVVVTLGGGACEEVLASRALYAEVQRLGIEKRLRLGALERMEECAPYPSLQSELSSYHEGIARLLAQDGLAVNDGTIALGAALSEESDGLVAAMISESPSRLHKAEAVLKSMTRELYAVSGHHDDAVTDIFSRHLESLDGWRKSLQRLCDNRDKGNQEETREDCAVSSVAETQGEVAPPIRAAADGNSDASGDPGALSSLGCLGSFPCAAKQNSVSQWVDSRWLLEGPPLSLSSKDMCALEGPTMDIPSRLQIAGSPASIAGDLPPEPRIFASAASTSNAPSYPPPMPPSHS